MVNSIQEIIALDKSARERVAEARGEAEKITAEAAADMHRLEEQMDASAGLDAQRACDKIKADYDAEMARIEKESDEKCARLDRMMEENSEVWRKEIIDRILNPGP